MYLNKEAVKDFIDKNFHLAMRAATAVESFDLDADVLVLVVNLGRDRLMKELDKELRVILKEVAKCQCEECRVE